MCIKGSLVISMKIRECTSNWNFLNLMLLLGMGMYIMCSLHLILDILVRNSFFLPFNWQNLNRSKKITIKKGSTVTHLYTQLAQCAVSDYGFLVVFYHAGWFGHSFVNCLAADLLLCPFHQIMIIWEKMSFFFFFFFCQTDNPQFNFIMYCYWTVSSVYMCKTYFTGS